MDKMAYLQQISSTPSSASSQPAGPFDLSHLLTKKNLLLGGLIVAALFFLMLIFSLIAKPSTKDQDLLTETWYSSHYLSETIDEYSGLLKSSALRTLTTSLRGVLGGLMLEESQLLDLKYGLSVESLESESIALTAKARQDQLVITLEDARLNGHLDRTFAREITMQIAYLISFQSALSARASSPDLTSSSQKYEANLQTIYNDFNSYRDLSL